MANSSSIGTSTKTGPRCDAPATVNASSMPSATSAALWMVRASLVTGAKIGGWSSSWRLPVPQRLAGARPPTTTNGDPPNRACATALTPLVTPGPAVSTASPGVRVSLPVASAAKAAVCSCRTSRICIGGSAFTAPSYIGKTWAPESVNMVLHPVGPCDGYCVLADVAGQLVAGVLGEVVGGVGRGSLRHGRRLASSSARAPRACGYTGSAYAL